MSVNASKYFNRELSWVEFNARVLGEGLRTDNPVLERLRFLAIAGMNFDEFFMVRVGGLKRQVKTKKRSRGPAGMTPRQQLAEIRKRIRLLVVGQAECLVTQILPELADHGITFLPLDQFSGQIDRTVTSVFEHEVFPLLTPVRVGVDEEFPFIGNLTLHIMFLLKPSEGDGGTVTAVVPVPRSLDRVVWLKEDPNGAYFALLEDVIIRNAAKLFAGYEIVESLVFRLTRDADLGVDEERDEDFVMAMEEIVVGRRTSFPVRLEICGKRTKRNTPLYNAVAAGLDLGKEDIYEIPGPLDTSGYLSLCDVDGHDDLRFVPREPVVPFSPDDDDSLFPAFAESEVLLHHPFESFDPMIRLLKEAVSDENVLAIKMTLYRTSERSPIVDSLIDAALNGKHVTVLVELKARFDEERNIARAQELERAGAIVIYGIANLKVHAKALLIVRKESEGVKRYVHLSTGNYNEKTARQYTDVGFLTSREDIAFDTGLFFNAITGYSSVSSLKRLTMAPHALKQRLIELVDREIARTQSADSGRIIAKLNSLADVDIVDALYRASSNGVQIDLIVRGICTLVPGVPGFSDNIRVISIVGRYLEHSRIVYCYNGGAEEVYLSSADWMPRNLERRVELMFPVSDENNIARLKGVLTTYLEDNTNAHELLPDGRYERRTPVGNAVNAQNILFEQAQKRAERLMSSHTRAFGIRRREA